MKEETTRTIPPKLHGQRLDACIALLEPQLTRSKVQRLIKEGLVFLNDRPAKKPSHKVAAGDRVTYSIDLPCSGDIKLVPRPVRFRILHEDKAIIVIDKPHGLCVYPGAAREEETLVHGLLYYFGQLSQAGDPLRPGIVHRLDKDTSGVIIVAKTDEAHARLAQAFKERRVEKTYLAISRGHMKDLRGTIDFPIGRHPVHRKKMSILSRAPRDAMTHWEVLEELAGATLLKVKIHTGRTHQIRVHLAAIGHPLLGDRLYGGPTRLILGQRNSLFIQRQMLHAHKVAFYHPLEDRRLEFTAPVPEDMSEVLKSLKR